MKLLVAGSRNIQAFDFSEYISENVELIITGGADGIDKLAEKYADEHRISKLVLRPKYKIYKRSAPIKRNELMVDIADEVIVVWDGKSKGSLHTINYTNKQNKPIRIIVIE